MSAHETFEVWRYARGGLPEEERARIEAHLAGCAECREALEAAREAQDVLGAAAQAPPPQVDWRRVDEHVLGAAARRLARMENGPRWAWVAGGLAVAVAASVLVAVLLRGRPPPGNGADVPAVQVARSGVESSSVESSAVAERWRDGAAAGALAAGQGLAAGDAVRTGRGGSATLRLPDASRVRLGEGSEVVLARAARDEVELELPRGQVVVQAAHVPRKAFRVKAGGVEVQVVGTVFSVVASEREVEVAVAEGRVRVELPGNTPRRVAAGERLVVERAGQRVRVGGLTAGERAGFKLLGVEVRPPPRGERSKSPEAPAVFPQASGAPPSVTPEPPGAGAVSAAGGAAASSDPVAPPPATSPAFPEDGWAQLPASPEPRPSPAAPAPPLPLTRPAGHGQLPETMEAIFLQRAEESLHTGRCEGYLLGLEELLDRRGAPGVRGKARILRARCFDDRLKPDQARREYSRYLQDFPVGPFAAEARRATAD